MKHFLALLLLVTTIQLTKAQSLFFDNIKETKWALQDTLTAPTFTEKNINAYKLPLPNGTSQHRVYQLSFKDSMEVRAINLKTSKVSEIKKYAYEVITDKAKKYIRVYYATNQSLSTDYEVGVTSTGTFITLYQRKKKK